MNNEQISPDLDDPQQIARQVADTQAALSDKIEALKEQVSSSFDNAEASVLDTVDSVKRTFSLQSQVDRHPWGWMVCSVAAGILVGMRLSNRRDASRFTSEFGPREHLLGADSARASWSDSGNTAQHDDSNSILREIRDVSVGTLLASARDMARSALPKQFSGVIDNIFNRTCSKLLKETRHNPS